MSDLREQTEKLLDMLSMNDVITYEGYCKNCDENPIGRTQWDSLLVLVGSKQMLLSGDMKSTMNTLQTICTAERTINDRR